jgi:hypothetical protein
MEGPGGAAIFIISSEEAKVSSKGVSFANRSANGLITAGLWKDRRARLSTIKSLIV